MAQETVYKSVIKNAAYIFFIKLFPALASVIVLILFSRNLPASDYGNYQNFWVRLLLLGTLAYAGLPVVIMTYSADFLKAFFQNIRRKHFLFWVLWMLVWALVFSLLNRKQIHLPFFLSLGLLLCYVVHAIQEALLMASRKMNGLLLINTLYAVYFLWVHHWFLKDFSLLPLLASLAAGMLLRSFALGWVLRKVYRDIRIAELLPDNLLKARNLWLHLGFYDLIQNIFRFIDKFILSLLLSSGVYAVYFNGSQTAEIPFLPYLLGAVANSVLIQLSDKKAGAQNPFQMIRVSGKLLSCLVFPLFFFLLFFNKEIFVLLLTEKYLPSASIFAMAILVLPLRAYNFTTLLQHYHRGAVINKGAVMDLLLALALMYPLYRTLGLPGIALGFVVSTYLQAAYYLFHTSRYAEVSLRSLIPVCNWLKKIILFGLLIFLVRFLFREKLSDTGLLITGGATAFLMTLSSFFYELKKEKII